MMHLIAIGRYALQHEVTMTNRKRMIRIPGMCAKFGGCTPSTIWRRVNDGGIPKPTKIGGMTIWDEDEVDGVIEAALAKRDTEAA